MILYFFNLEYIFMSVMTYRQCIYYYKGIIVLIHNE